MLYKLFSITTALEIIYLRQFLRRRLFRYLLKSFQSEKITFRHYMFRKGRLFKEGCPYWRWGTLNFITISWEGCLFERSAYSREYGTVSCYMPFYSFLRIPPDLLGDGLKPPLRGVCVRFQIRCGLFSCKQIFAWASIKTKVKKCI